MPSFRRDTFDVQQASAMDFPHEKGKGPDLPDTVPLVPSCGGGGRRNVLLAAVSAQLFIVVMGMVTAYSAPASVDMRRPGSRFRDITQDQITWIASLPPLTGMVGNALSGYLCHRFGRKTVLMTVSLSYTLGWLMIAYAPAMPLVYAGRLTSGFSAGLCSVAVAAYAVEISTVEIRGLLSTGFQVAFSLGVLAVMGLGAVLRWSWLAVSGAALVVVSAGAMSAMPESPHWLVGAGRSGEAAWSLLFFRGHRDKAVKELREIVEHRRDDPKGGLRPKELLQPRLYKPLLIAIALMFFQQFSGVNSLMSYSVELFQITKNSVDPSLATVIVATVQLAATCLSGVLVDRVGRRALYVTSGALMLLSLLAGGAYDQLSARYDVAELGSLSLVPLLSLVTYIGAFALGFGPIPFVVTPEMVPTRMRSFLIAVASVSCSFFGFVVTKTYDDLRSLLGMPGVYYTYAVFTLVGALFYWIFVPETKGRTIHDIHRSFSVPLDN